LKGVFDLTDISWDSDPPAGITSGSICAIDVIQANRRKAMQKMCCQEQALGMRNRMRRVFLK